MEGINQRKRNQAEDILHSLDLMDFMGPLVVLSVGFTVALCTFALEMLLHRKKICK